MSQAGQAGRFAGGGGIIQTINGDTGSITGPVVTIYANNAANGAGATVKFVNSGTVSTLQLTDDIVITQNVLLGGNSGNLTYTGVSNVALGCYSLYSLTSGSDNTCIGDNAGQIITSGSYNTIIGTYGSPTTGNDNILIGYATGSRYLGAETSNILIHSPGVLGENQTLVIGLDHAVFPSTQYVNKAYIGGITGNTVSNAQLVTINSSTGQLGVTNSVPSNWSDISGAVNATAGNGYFVNATSTSTLPAAPAQGDTVSYIVDTANILTIQASPGQAIRIGSTISAPAGTAKSNGTGNSVTLVYRTVTNSWISSATNGTWTVV